MTADSSRGFRIDWTTTTRQSGDPDNPDVETKQQSVLFLPTGKPGVYRSEIALEAFSGEPFWWSRVDGTSLHTHMAVIGPDGRWQMQTYSRILHSSGMKLVFSRVRDGEQARTVEANLVKVGN